jgi:hypothetical protein
MGAPPKKWTDRPVYAWNEVEQLMCRAAKNYRLDDKSMNRAG